VCTVDRRAICWLSEEGITLRISLDQYGSPIETVISYISRSGDRIPVATKFSAPVQTGPGVHPLTPVTASPGVYPLSCAMGTGCLSWGYSDWGVELNTHTPSHLAPSIKEYSCTSTPPLGLNGLFLLAYLLLKENHFFFGLFVQYDQ
jgi:hypothetical protein